PGTYHFYFGDETGSPGSIMTFFPWPGARRGRHGNGQVTTTSFSVPRDSLGYWKERADDFLVSHFEASDRFGDQVLALRDPDGLQIELIATEDREGHAISRFHSATLQEEGYERTAKLLTEVMGFRLAGEHGTRYRFIAGDGGPGSIVDVVCSPDAQRGLGGAGTVHHIAWRTPDDDQQKEWRKKLVELDYNVSPIMDRNYFHSIYYREPGGILFEIATDPPGFLIDEPVEMLGTTLKLPPFYEPMRSEIEAALPPVRLQAVSA
ncbi:MAG TPA: ring-cleaving dioxygenase, partial [Bryobacteraceae bacterium]|nr:ring-cleaving dioxygenase [Bryobacteraceae bacterium]